MGKLNQISTSSNASMFPNTRVYFFFNQTFIKAGTLGCMPDRPTSKVAGNLAINTALEYLQEYLTHAGSVASD
ncbi:MAG: hypothetical protein R2769_09880 [Saprospiraceae bacterium]